MSLISTTSRASMIPTFSGVPPAAASSRRMSSSGLPGECREENRLQPEVRRELFRAAIIVAHGIHGDGMTARPGRIRKVHERDLSEQDCVLTLP